MNEKPRQCGAKTRKGTPCPTPPIAGKKRCRMHGGTNPGAPRGNKNAVKHGIYAEVLSDEDRKVYDRIELGSIDDEIRMARIRLRRALEEQVRQQSVVLEADATVSQLRQQLEVQEIKTTSVTVGGQTQQQSEVKRVRKDYRREINALIKLIAELELKRIEIANSGGGGSAEEMAMMIKETLDQIDAVNSPPPEGA